MRYQLSTFSLLSLVPVIFMGIGACSSTPGTMQVVTDYNSAYRFEDKRKYAVVRPNGAFSAAGVSARVESLDDNFAQRLVTYIEQHLLERGYTVVEPGSAELLVTFFGESRSKVDANMYNSGFHYTKCWDPRFCSRIRRENVSMQQYAEGWLFIDVIDPVEDRIEWRGTATRRLTNSETKGGVEDSMLKHFVDSVLSEYPPQD